MDFDYSNSYGSFKLEFQVFHVGLSLIVNVNYNCLHFTRCWPGYHFLGGRCFSTCLLAEYNCGGTVGFA
jgi:hypothetical protein